ncbi:hypothetical protein PtB15_4B50 [Puccinia triticina]|nr:hypothetical protein PtB15_4B50 [Puccinia triticina]
MASLQARAASRQVQTVLRRPAESCRLTPSLNHPADWSTRSVDQVKFSYAPLQLHRCKGACSLLSDNRPSLIASLQARAARRQVQTVLRRPAESYRLTPSHKHPADWSTSLPPSPSSPPTDSDCSPTPRRVLWTDSKPQATRRLVDKPPSKPEQPADTFRLFRLFYDAPPSLVDCLQATSTRPTGPRDN